MEMSQPDVAVAVAPVKAWDIRVRHRCSGLPRTSGLLNLALLSRRLARQNEIPVQTDCPAPPQLAGQCLHTWHLQVDYDATCI